ncbi:unnamed protein product [Tuber aestivum]|uniref:Uncharacterized protein n=1 Tax=Tuber aestivum TaxID=59557 RepID=A0A292PYC5_9PEZI|nr:unnamed protein product [Tuber aestivum]
MAHSPSHNQGSQLPSPACFGRLPSTHDLMEMESQVVVGRMQGFSRRAYHVLYSRAVTVVIEQVVGDHLFNTSIPTSTQTFSSTAQGVHCRHLLSRPPQVCKNGLLPYSIQPTKFALNLGISGGMHGQAILQKSGEYESSCYCKVRSAVEERIYQS